VNWVNIMPGIPSQAYLCAHCGNQVATQEGWFATSSYTNKPAWFIGVCHKCSRPTFIDDDGRQFPGAAFGDEVGDLPDGLKQLYAEARSATGANCYTAAVLCCRKILMHVAVQKGAAAGDKFIKYVEFLAEKNFIPPDAKEWVDHIRTKSNEANHEISLMTRPDAEELLAFTEMLLKFVFEFPAAIRRKGAGVGGAKRGAG
jgi:hypothetical protein